MRAEVIAIGDELTSGQRLDTNSQWISQRLGEIGIEVLYHSTVGDDLDANVRVFREAFQRVEVVVATGGLGPTADDLTRQALATATGTELELHQDVLEFIRSLFARRRREMPQRNVVQAMFPQGSRVIPNPHGSAPGIDMSVAVAAGHGCRVFALPGVPAEMREMWQQSVEPALREAAGPRRFIRHHRIKCFGVGESDLEQMLPDLIRRGRRPVVGITVSKATITLRITADASSPDECQALITPTIETIQQCLGSLVFGEEDDELEHAVVRLLQQRGETLAVAEWGPGGLLSQWLSEVDPAAAAFVGSFVVRSADCGLLPEELIADHGPDAAAIATSMAQQCREQFSADYGLAVGRFPEFDEHRQEPHQVAFALATPDNVLTREAPFAGHPDILKSLTTKRALNLLRLTLLRGGRK